MPDNNQTIERINALAALAKTRELTAEEVEERLMLRAQYLKDFRANFRQQLDNTFVEKDDGTKVPLKDWQQEQKNDAEQAFRQTKKD